MNRIAAGIGWIVLAVIAREIVFIGSVAVKNRVACRAARAPRPTL